MVIHEDDSNSIAALIAVHGIAASNLDAALVAYGRATPTLYQLTRIATMSAVVADLSKQMADAMLKAAGEQAMGALLKN